MRQDENNDCITRSALRADRSALNGGERRRKRFAPEHIQESVRASARAFFCRDLNFISVTDILEIMEGGITVLSFLSQTKGKKVEYIELIYDLIFVYLISRNGDLLHTIEGGFIRPMAAFTYLASALIILQIWYFSTLYVNRYGCAGWRTYIPLYVNMYLLYYMADGIRDNWGAWYYQYHLAWMLILLNLALQYYLQYRQQSRENEDIRRHLRFHLRMLLIEAGIVAATIPVYLKTGLAFGPWAMIFGYLIPVFGRRIDVLVPVDFTHLTERVMLYVVFTFGEMILGIAGYFTGQFEPMTALYALAAFLIVAGLFSSYGYYYDCLLDRNRITTGTAYMMLHILLLVSLSNITGALEFMRQSYVATMPKSFFLAGSLLLYYVCLILTQPFATKRIGGGRKTYIFIAAGFILYLVVIKLTYRWGLVCCLASVALIYLQLITLNHAGENKEETASAAAGESCAQCSVKQTKRS